MLHTKGEGLRGEATQRRDLEHELSTGVVVCSCVCGVYVTGGQLMPVCHFNLCILWVRCYQGGVPQFTFNTRCLSILSISCFRGSMLTVTLHLAMFDPEKD